MEFIFFEYPCLKLVPGEIMVLLCYGTKALFMLQIIAVKSVPKMIRRRPDRMKE